ncbi:MAG: hypothetical protein ABNO52_01070 [Candidatus Shikimatogenerans sp. Tser]|uniref:PD-(D/E)XK endonuclease-like domain-containing protein n=1 Tax=Candidatus Shikimatogenerans sp. Tser TaxID=3158568 RepID=A0AAU7QQS6_9FLAO
MINKIIKKIKVLIKKNIKNKNINIIFNNKLYKKYIIFNKIFKLKKKNFFYIKFFFKKILKKKYIYSYKNLYCILYTIIIKYKKYKINIRKIINIFNKLLLYNINIKFFFKINNYLYNIENNIFKKKQKNILYNIYKTFKKKILKYKVIFYGLLLNIINKKNINNKKYFKYNKKKYINIFFITNYLYPYEKKIIKKLLKKKNFYMFNIYKKKINKKNKKINIIYNKNTYISYISFLKKIKKSNNNNYNIIIYNKLLNFFIKKQYNYYFYINIYKKHFLLKYYLKLLNIINLKLKYNIIRKKIIKNFFLKKKYNKKILFYIKNINYKNLYSFLNKISLFFIKNKFIKYNIINKLIINSIINILKYIYFFKKDIKHFIIFFKKYFKYKKKYIYNYKKKNHINILNINYLFIFNKKEKIFIFFNKKFLYNKKYYNIKYNIKNSFFFYKNKNYNLFINLLIYSYIKNNKIFFLSTIKNKKYIFFLKNLYKINFLKLKTYKCLLQKNIYKKKKKNIHIYKKKKIYNNTIIISISTIISYIYKNIYFYYKINKIIFLKKNNIYKKIGIIIHYILYKIYKKYIKKFLNLNQNLFNKKYIYNICKNILNYKFYKTNQKYNIKEKIIKYIFNIINIDRYYLLNKKKIYIYKINFFKKKNIYNKYNKKYILYGYIDRIDFLNKEKRLIDYKSNNNINKNINFLIKNIKNKTYYKYLQILLYSLITNNKYKLYFYIYNKKKHIKNIILNKKIIINIKNYIINKIYNNI